MSSEDKDSITRPSGMLIRNPMVRMLFKACALICVVLGFICVFLPLLPTTPFLLLATFFSLRSSPTIYFWLLNHKLLGPPLRQYLDERSISRKVYLRAVTFLWLTMSLSIWLVTMIWVKCLLLVIAISVTVYLTRLKRRGQEGSS